MLHLKDKSTIGTLYSSNIVSSFRRTSLGFKELYRNLPFIIKFGTSLHLAYSMAFPNFKLQPL